MKVGLTVGVFDYLHPGHVMMFEECKTYCDYLLVGINDGANLEAHKLKPIQTLKERILMVESTKYVDEIFTYSGEDELRQILQVKNYDLRFIGADHQDSPITGDDISGHMNRVIFTTRNHGFSSTVMKYRAYCNFISRDRSLSASSTTPGYSYEDVLSGNLFPKN
jgi:glycerol-3-phosphate cytidylyltransferase